MEAGSTVRLTNKQLAELKVIKYYIPSNIKFKRITSKQIKLFFDWSDKGIKPNINFTTDRSGFSALYWGKQRRDLQVSQYIEDWGYTLSLWDLLTEPKYIREYLGKALGKVKLL